MDDKAKYQLRREFLSIDQEKVVATIRSIKLPPKAMKDHVKVSLLYSAYAELASKESSVTIVSKPCFLYIWICCRGSNSSIHMRDYSFFTDNLVNMSKISYRDFTQTFVDSTLDPLDYSEIDIHYTGEFVTTLQHVYPISLRGLFDNMNLFNNEEYILLSEGGIVYMKTRPRLMEDERATVDLRKRAEPGQIIMRVLSSNVKVDHSHTVVLTESVESRDTLVVILSKYVSYGTIEHATQKHLFSFPNREIHYSQIVDWVSKKRLPHSSMNNLQHIVADNLMDNCRYEFINATLDTNRRYLCKGGEVYRIKGDVVLQIVIHSNKSRDYLRSIIVGICSELDKSIAGDYPDPLELDASNIAKLRATNGLVFDGLYCRKAPPIVQPLIIKESEIEDSLKKGKMVLRYKGMLYTTRDADVSGHQNYLGMINRFGSYDPSKLYIPIIRTYKTNHLLSRNFKEFKAYLLRHSNNSNFGYLSRDDILLPPKLEYLYRIKVINPEAEIAGIHSKKIVISNASKVCTSEVPDSVKTLLGTSSAKRVIGLSEGTGLLDICNVSKQKAMLYFVMNRQRYMDMIGLNIEDIESNVSSHTIDHRVYGKALEDLTGLSLVVFSMDGLMPYRYSKCTARDCLLLFRSDSGSYDRIVVDPYQDIESNMSHVVDMYNSSSIIRGDMIERRASRPIDYTFAFVRLVSYLHNTVEALGLHVTYRPIKEINVEALVEAVYARPIYYEGFVQSTKSNYSHTSVVSYRHQKCRVIPTLDLIESTLSPLIHSIGKSKITIYSPVDMNMYNRWSFLLEDCLYYSSNCYKLDDREEVLIVDAETGAFIEQV